MTTSRRCALVLATAILCALATRPASAGAQEPAPPEIVFQPLVAAAEGEAVGQPNLAHAHAETALRFAPAGSPLAARAQAVVLATQAGPSGPTEDAIWEPLVVAAENDAAAGRHELALDRLGVVMRTLPAASALATRARDLYAVVSVQRADVVVDPAAAPASTQRPPPQSWDRWWAAQAQAHSAPADPVASESPQGSSAYGATGPPSPPRRNPELGGPITLAIGLGIAVIGGGVILAPCDSSGSGGLISGCAAAGLGGGVLLGAGLITAIIGAIVWGIAVANMPAAPVALIAGPGDVGVGVAGKF